MSVRYIAKVKLTGHCEATNFSTMQTRLSVSETKLYLKGLKKIRNKGNSINIVDEMLVVEVLRFF